MAIIVETGNRIVNFILNYILQVCSLSSSHGSKYMVRENRHPMENLLWIFAYSSSMFFAIWVGNHYWVRLAEHPTITSVERDRFAWNTTFPAVTVCPNWNPNETALDEFAKKHGIKDVGGLEFFLRKLTEFDYKKPFDLYDFDELPSNLYAEALLTIVYPLRVQATTGEGVILRKKRLIGHNGICYTFNSMIADKLSDRSPNEKIPDIFEVHALDSDAFAQILEMDVGYNLFVHSPQEIPRRTGSIPCGILNSCFMVFRASAITCTDRAKRLAIEQRKCRLPDEPMDGWHRRVYSHELCRSEARIKEGLKLCDCIPYMAPNPFGDKICDFKGMQCLHKYGDLLQDAGTKAECLPNCEDTHYVSQSVQRVAWFQGSNLRWELASPPRMRFKREVMFSTGDMFVSWGSTTGLFLGCSILTFVELIYFCTIKLFWDIERKRSFGKRFIQWCAGLLGHK